MIFIYDVLEVSQYIIDYCREKKYYMSNLKLQKVLYYVQAEFLVTTNNPCFKDKIEAWMFGPVVESVYRNYRVYAGGNIAVGNSKQRHHIKRQDMKLIQGIVDECDQYSNSSLMQIIFKQSPYRNVYQKYFHNTISNKTLKDFFEEE